jgi:HEAT repeat protein
VKRLRLPDLLCVRTGLRVEVRAKSKLAIKMSDAPANPDRRWRSGLASQDMIAFVLIREREDGILHAADNAELFWVEALEKTEAKSKLGPPKSASEGAEQDREWPSTVANCNGVVESVAEDRLLARLTSGRKQTYQLRDKTAYFAVGGTFLAESEFLAGLPSSKAAFPLPGQMRWNPRDLLASAWDIDRHVAVKALGVVGNSSDIPALTNLAELDRDGRVALEAAASLIRLGDEHGLDLFRHIITQPAIAFLRMEAMLALAEFHGTPLAARCAEMLSEYAQDDAFVEDEVRQAAIWGLGKDGLHAYDHLMQFLDAANDDELIHAVCAFGRDVDTSIAEKLVAILTNPASSERRMASASLILARTIPAPISAPLLAGFWRHSTARTRNWVLATLGQIDPLAIQHCLNDDHLAEALQPLQLLLPETNWSRSEQAMDKLTFVRKQTV